MCEASKAMKDLTFAKEGQDLVVRSHQHGYGQRIFALQGTSTYCCIPFGATVQFINLPGDFQQSFGVGSEVEVVLASPEITQETHYENRDDIFVIPAGDPADPKRFCLSDLPYGAQCRVIRVPVEDIVGTVEAVDAEIASVLQPAPVPISAHRHEHRRFLERA